MSKQKSLTFNTLMLADLNFVEGNVWRTKKPVFDKVYVRERFELNFRAEKLLREMKPMFGYNGFGEFVFYRTYSRIKKDGGQENWADCVIRVINGVMSIRKNHYIENDINWDENYWQAFASKLSVSMFQMKWLPPGRGLWACGTNYIYERGSAALFNCGYSDLTNLATDIEWIMDMLMNGVGIGFEAEKDESIIPYKTTNDVMKIIIGDSREEWCISQKLKIQSRLTSSSPKLEFIYDEIRPAGLVIKGFGGISSGPEPLRVLHNKTDMFFDKFLHETDYNSTLLKADIANQVGCCVVAGNVRRSAEICIADINNETFLNLKNYDKHSYRGEHGWMSNNSAKLKKPADFEKLPEIAERAKTSGDPGYINLCNFPFGRIGKDDKCKEDLATGINPCGESLLEDKELCNLADSYPTKCSYVEEWYDACKYATFYCSTVSLLKTHWKNTNEVILRNQRIGVGFTDYTGWKFTEGVSKTTRYMREGYKIVRQTNKELNEEANVPESIRVTVIKPGGTIPKLVGVTSGIGHPNFHHHIRRVRVQNNSPIDKFLKDKGIPNELDVNDKLGYTRVYEFPVLSGPAKPAAEVSIWEQAMNLVLIQREWADQAVSNTLTFKPKWKLICSRSFTDIDEYWLECNTKTLEYDIGTDWDYAQSRTLEGEQYRLQLTYSEEYMEVKLFEFDPTNEEDQIESVLSSIAPLTKSVSLLPQSPVGAYRQMPEEGITVEEYQRRLDALKPIDWTKFGGSDGLDTKFCEGDQCSVL